MTDNTVHVRDPGPLSGSDLHDYRARLLLSEILEIMSEFRPLGETLEAIAQTVCHRLNFQSCAIMLERSGSDLLRIEGASGIAAGYIEAVNHSHPIHIRDPILSGGPSSEAFRTLQPVMIEDTETDERARRWRALTRQYGIRSYITVPLCSRGSAIGTLNCYRHAAGSFDENEIAALTSVATQSGIAIDIARMVEIQNQSIHQLSELATALEEKRQLLERASEIQDALTELVLTNRGLNAITSILARVTGCPTVIQDQFFTVLAASNGTGDSLDASVVSSLIIQPESMRGRTFEMRTPIELPAVPGVVPEIARAVAPIIAGSDLFGYVSIALPSLPATELARRALEHAATVIALEMVKDRLSHEAELRVRRGFADDLVAGRYDNPEQIRERSRYLGYDLRGPFQVLVFDIDGFEQYVEEKQLSVAAIDAMRLRFFDVVQGVAKTHTPHALVAGRYDQLALVLAAAGDPRIDIVDEVVRAVRRTSRDTLRGISISVGIGGVYPDLSRIQVSHSEATRSLGVIRRLGGRAKSIRYAELGVIRLLFQVENPAELVAFARGRLTPVVAYDGQHEGILMETLSAYLASDQSVSRAAQSLSTHPNTVRYRLLKIEELLGVSLKDTTALLDLQLASLVLKIIDTPAAPGHMP